MRKSKKKCEKKIKNKVDENTVCVQSIIDGGAKIYIC
jgi:hypothetical protein